MKKALLILMVLLVLLYTSGGMAQELMQMRFEGLLLSDPLSGTIVRPEGADASQAVFKVQYTFPQFYPDSATANLINAYFQRLDADGLFDVWDGSYEINFEMMHNSARYLSIMLTRYTASNAQESACAVTFALDGIYAGKNILLNEMLGIDQLSQAEAIVYELVWQIIQRELIQGTGDYLEGITKHSLYESFAPEKDFYLDDDGNIVFFIQPGFISAEIAGILRFPFSPAELLAEI